jgi:16S rRNA (uracil1498-N3)-methyltransferase
VTPKPDPGHRPPRFFVAPDGLTADPIVLGPEEARHVVRVLRLRPGAQVVLFDGQTQVDAALDAVSEQRVTARRLSEPRTTIRIIDLTLIQGVPRSTKMDDIVRMGTEIGLAAIVPALTDRSVTKPAEHRVDRWRRIAREAAKQCGRADLPMIPPLRTLDTLLADLTPTDLFVVPWERATESLAKVARGIPFWSATILIGPEGGLTEQEVAGAVAAGAHPVSLGPLVLRTETAGIVAAAMLYYEIQAR